MNDADYMLDALALLVPMLEEDGTGADHAVLPHASTPTISPSPVTSRPQDCGWRAPLEQSARRAFRRLLGSSNPSVTDDCDQGSHAGGKHSGARGLWRRRLHPEPHAPRRGRGSFQLRRLPEQRPHELRGGRAGPHWRDRDRPSRPVGTVAKLRRDVGDSGKGAMVGILVALANDSSYATGSRVPELPTNVGDRA